MIITLCHTVEIKRIVAPLETRTVTPFYVTAYENCLTEHMFYTLYTLRGCSHVNAASAAVNLNSFFFFFW